MRAAFTLNSQPKSLGWVFHPKLNLDVTDLPSMPGWNMGLQAGPLMADKRQHSYYYGVAAPYASASRPAYEAGGGFAGMQYLMGLSKRFDGHWVGAFVRYDNLNKARFADSPLVRSRSYAAVGVAVSWIFDESATRVLTDD
jgi:outer membrane scaffolding protein for murein synthesis (MipA/OmpV family)